jgi:formate hydrogenlyase transcriptional activator
VSRSVCVVGQLALALAQVHTETSLVLALGRFFSNVADLIWVELVVKEDVGAERALRATPGNDAPQPARPLALPPLLPVVHTSRLLHVRADSKHPELRRAHALGAGALLVMPLHSCDGDVPRSIGRVVLLLRRARSADLSDEAVTTALGDVVSASLAVCRTFARIGEVSRRAYVESRELRDALERQQDGSRLVARAPVTRRLLDEVVPQVARLDMTVLLLGESGVGKELLAAELHRRSRRASRPMLSINCGALPETLVDSTLFGHERGAFTGAHSRQLGVFERAHRGTLFLDEVGELSPASQTKLLRVLEHGEVERVGSAATLKVDVRVIAATNRDLVAMVQAGSFRLDLYHRLAIVPLVIPPLRDRPEDLAALVPTLLERLARRAGASVIMPTPAQMKALRAYHWPGNVRELENVLARALLFAEKGRLALDAELLGGRRSAASTILTFAESSRRCIEMALAASGGKIHGERGAAALLGLKPTTLQSKMRKLGLTRRGG